MTLREYLRLVVKHRILLLVGVAVGLLFGAFSIATADPGYRGTVSFFISSTGEGTAVAANVGDQFALRRVNSYLALLRTDRLGQMVVDDAGLETSARATRSRISGTADLNTVLLTARVTAPSRAEALTIADSLSRAFPELVSEIETPAVGEPTVRLEVVSGPSVSEVAIRTRLILASRALAGLLVAAALVLARELTDNRLDSIDRSLALSAAPLLGLVTYDRQASRSPLILDDGLQSIRAEEYRQIRTSVQFLDTDDHVRVIAMTSSISGEGKSVTAANLAIAIARSGQRVALVDADLRKPMIGTLFGLEDSVGLVDVLRGHAALDDVLQPWGSFELMVLPAGGATAIPSELLGTVAMTRLIAELRSRFDFVIIDNPPLVPVTDAAIVATQTDGVVLLVRPDRVTKAQFQRSLGNLERVRANLLGLVASQVSERLSPYTAGYYGTRTDEGSGGLGEMPPNDRSTQHDADPESGFLLEAALRRNPRSRSK